MFSTLVTILAVLALSFGGVGATALAAQDSLPGESLYQLKIQSEDLRLQWQHNEMEQIGLALEFANRRIEEMQAMLGKGQALPASLMQRLQNQLDTALRLAAGLDNKNMEPALAQIRQTLREQDRLMAQLQDGANEDPILLRTREQIQLRLSWTDEGQTDPSTLRARYGPFGKDVTLPATTGNQGEGVGPGPFITGTPTPGSGYGPGPGLQATCTCTPQSGQGPQPAPGLGNGAGPGPQPSSTCTPQSGMGPQVTPDTGGGNDNGPQPTPGSGNDANPGQQPTSAPQDGNGPGSGNGNKP